MTKKEMFSAIRDVVADNADMVAFIDHEIELLNRKSNSPRKPTKTQRENEIFKENILETLVTVGSAVTMKELFEVCEPIKDLTIQRVTHLMTALIKDGKAEREIIKKVRYYKAV